MPSRRDQLQSYQFMLQRVISALVMRETDPAQAPLRRGVGAAFIGFMVAVVAAAGFGVYGLLTKVGGSQWRTNGAVVVERESGATFVYRDGELTPTLNYSSALLLAASAPPRVFTVARKSLAGVPHGIMRGIPFAPAAVPDAKHLLGAPWLLCTGAVRDATGQPSSRTALAVGVGAPGGRGLGDAGLLVRDKAGTVALVWTGHRYRLLGAGTPSSLFGATAEPVQVGTAWLEGLPGGSDIGPLPVTGVGRPAPTVPGRKVGDILMTSVGTGTDQAYVVLDDGVAALTPLKLAVYRGQYDVTETRVTEAVVNRVPRSDALRTSSDRVAAAPERPPTLAALASDPGAICAEFGTGETPRLVVGADPDAALAGTATSGAADTGEPLADFVSVRSEWAALIRITASPKDPGGAYALVTDGARRYPLGGTQILSFLGFAPSQAIPVPVGLAKRIPVGPALSIDGAAETAER
jgi:type VII secretion protein EccB